MATIDVQVSASSDDAIEAGGGSPSITGTQMYFGATPSGTMRGGARFTGITIPSGATIDVAYISAYIYSTSNDDINCTIYAEDTASPGTFTTTNGDVDGRTLTTAGVTWTASDVLGGGAAAWKDSPSIVSVIEELMASYTSYSSGSIVILVQSAVSQAESGIGRTYDQTGNTYGMKLHIEYTEASGGVSVEPTAVSATASTVNPTAILGNLSITPDAAGGPFTYTDGPGGDITSSDDAQMSSAWPTNNGGGHANFQFATSQRCLIRFDLQAIPAGATCTGATLYLYHSYTAEGGGTVTVSVYEISDANGDWLAGDNDISLANAGENCWNAKAADGAGGVTTAWAGSAGLGTATTDYKTPAVGSFSFNGGSDIGTEFTCALDETTVESWFGQASNNGLIMWPDSNSGHVAQSDNATSGYRPKLVVQYSYGTATASTVDPTVNIGTTGVNVTPTAISATAATVDPGVALGSINISPATISATATTADPTAALGSLSIEPTANTATAATVDPGVGYGNLSIGPATNTATGTTVDPSVACGSLSISPALSAATVTAADPIVEESGGPVNVIPTAIVAWATTAIGSVSGGEPARTGRKKGLLAPW